MLTKNEMSVIQVLTGKSKMELKQNEELESIGKLDEEKNTEMKQIKEDYITLFNSDIYWENLKVAIALNIDSSIKNKVNQI